MIFIDFLWMLVWSGIFAEISPFNLSVIFSNPVSFLQAVRAYFPLAAVYVCILWILAKRSRFPLLGNPVCFLFFYCLTGILTSMFLSPARFTALYWAMMYLSPVLVLWIIIEKSNSIISLRKIIYLNYLMVIIVFVMLIPEVFRVGAADERFSQFYNLPFGLGFMRANGVGRFALVAAIIAFIRFIYEKRSYRYIWLSLLPPALFLLAQTRSRTSLLGLAIASVLFVYIRGIDLRFLAVGPITTYIVWVSGIKWRLHGEVQRVFFLTGREYTWQRGLEQIMQSPFMGWGFHADRLLLQSDHMHNSYLHAAIHSGIIGVGFFIAALAGIWILIRRARLFQRVRNVRGPDQPLLVESILIIGFLTARSFFESTAAFYGVDLLLLAPAMVFIWMWAKENPVTD